MPDNSQKKWYEDWIQVFKSGTHTDSSGHTRAWTNDDLDKIVANYNTKEHEAPIVFGHPKTDDPAFGWVQEVRRFGDTLEVKLHKVLPEFIDAVNKGLYRKISVALTGDNSLRHVGFLGAVPPAIKGLQHAFGENEQEFTTFNQELNNSFTQRMEEKTVEETLLEKLFSSFKKNSKEVDEVKNAFTEELKPQIKKELEAEFSEQLDAEKTRADELQAELDKIKHAQKTSEHKEFAEELVKATRIKADQVGLVSEFCSILSDVGEIEFSEGSEKESALDKFKEFMETLPRQTELGEFATGDKLDPNAKKDPEFAAGEEIAKSLEV